MKNQFQLTIDGNEATFEIADALPAMAGAMRPKIDPARPVLLVTTMRDGKKVWSGVGTQEVAEGVPIIRQFTTEQLTEIYRRVRRRWYETQVNPPSA